MLYREQARAKINLTLRVFGRRADGYHALESLVSFAHLADEVTLTPDEPPAVAVTGPYAGAIEGENLLARVLVDARALEPGLRTGAVSLHKVLPVAAGIGGGSADAAALLRALRAANGDARLDWMVLAASIGADVPVCLGDTPALMWGKGEGLAALPAATTPHPPMAAVLVNPHQPLATRAVFARLGAQLLSVPQAPPDAGKLQFGSIADVAGYVAAKGNDLEAPALQLLPVIGAMKSALSAQAGCLLSAMSGSGPTCFGLFATPAAAERAARVLREGDPGWWVAETAIDFPAGR